MNRSMVVLVTLLLGAVGRAGVAGSIVYSWEGTIAPQYKDSDVWELGDAGKPFFLAISVDESAVDWDTAVDQTSFEPSNVVFLIDGAPLTSLGIEFGADFAIGGISLSESASRDKIGISLLEPEFNGWSVEFLSVNIRLPASTFTFTNDIEAPPLFSPTATIDRGGGASINDR